MECLTVFAPRSPQLSGGTVAPAFLVFAAFTAPSLPLALAVSTPRPRDQPQPTNEGGSAVAGGPVEIERLAKVVMLLVTALLFLGVTLSPNH